MKVFGTFALGNGYTKPAPLLSLPSERSRDTASVKDDALNTVAVISTQYGYQETRGLL
jgi:hypothetical protein